MDVNKLYEMLKKIQEPKGYFFNKDRELVDQLLHGQPAPTPLSNRSEEVIRFQFAVRGFFSHDGY